MNAVKPSMFSLSRAQNPSFFSRELDIALTLDKSLQPRSLFWILYKLEVQRRMSWSTETYQHWGTVRVALIGIVEPRHFGSINRPTSVSKVATYLYGFPSYATSARCWIIWAAAAFPMPKVRNPAPTVVFKRFPV
jgi:hypothetical protein